MLIIIGICFDLLFELWDLREDVAVSFPKSSGSNLPMEYFKTEKELAEVKWKREKVEEDIEREQSLLNQINFNFRIKKQEFIKFLADNSPFGTQVDF